MQFCRISFSYMLWIACGIEINSNNKLATKLNFSKEDHMAVKKTKIKTPELDEFLEEIKQKAYENFLKRQQNNLQGDHLEDWLSAEKEIKKKYSIKT